MRQRETERDRERQRDRQRERRGEERGGERGEEIRGEEEERRECMSRWCDLSLHPGK